MQTLACSHSSRSASLGRKSFQGTLIRCKGRNPDRLEGCRLPHPKSSESCPLSSLPWSLFPASPPLLPPHPLPPPSSLALQSGGKRRSKREALSGGRGIQSLSRNLSPSLSDLSTELSGHSADRKSALRTLVPSLIALPMGSTSGKFQGSLECCSLPGRVIKWVVKRLLNLSSLNRHTNYFVNEMSDGVQGLRTSTWGLGELDLGLDTFIFPRWLQPWENRLNHFAFSRVWVFFKLLNYFLPFPGCPHCSERPHLCKLPPCAYPWQPSIL